MSKYFKEVYKGFTVFGGPGPASLNFLGRLLVRWVGLRFVFFRGRGRLPEYGGWREGSLFLGGGAVTLIEAMIRN